MAEAKETRNLYQDEHTHTCPQCHKPWSCKLSLSPETAAPYAMTVPGRKLCWSDVSPLCVACMTPEAMGLVVCSNSKCGKLYPRSKGKLCPPCATQASVSAERDLARKNAKQ